MPRRTTSYRSWVETKLTDPRLAANYLNAAIRESPEAFLKALRKVSEAQRMSKVAEGAGVSRESLYRMTTETGNPTYSSLDGILRALGLRLLVAPVAPAEPSQVEKAKI